MTFFLPTCLYNFYTLFIKIYLSIFVLSILNTYNCKKKRNNFVDSTKKNKTHTHGANRYWFSSISTNFINLHMNSIVISISIATFILFAVSYNILFRSNIFQDDRILIFGAILRKAITGLCQEKNPFYLNITKYIVIFRYILKTYSESSACGSDAFVW